jgi:lysophospholipase L1-like esterase
MLIFAVFAGAMRVQSSLKSKPPIAVEQAPAEKPPPAAPIPNLEVPPGSLDSFYASLRRGGVTRILHYGDSPVTADSITSDIRRLLQARFGDAGHGYLLIAKPWAWYGHSGVKLEGEGWKILPASQAREADGIHGLGGVSFRGEAGATSRATLPDSGYARVIVYYLAQPDGGRFSVAFGENAPVGIDTAGEEKRPAFAEIMVPAGSDSLELRVVAGKVRLFGYRFDKDHPGVQYSSLGINGAQIQMALRYFEPRQWAVELQHEDPALVVLNYGTNESIYPKYVDNEYPEELGAVIARIRAAVPNASLILMGPMDRGVMSGGEISTPESLTKLIEAQRQIARETGCAFFNTFAAMGGEGTMGRWYHAQPRLVSADFMHPMPAGAAIVGGLFESALVKSYEDSPR